jgi:sugar lactone lactonase YvrE
MIASERIELAVRAAPLHGEGPWWDSENRTLLWVDMVGRMVYRSDPLLGTSRSWAQPDTTAAAIGTSNGGTLVLLGSGLAMLDELTGAVTWHEQVAGHGDVVRFNDGACDPEGRLLFGSKTGDPAAQPGALYVLEGRRPARRAFTPMVTSNGVAWSTDGRTLFVVDSASRSVKVLSYDLDGGLVTGQRDEWATPGPGSPDGMAIDVDDHLWIAMYGAGRVLRVAPGGRVVDVAHLPVTGVTSCTFGSDGYDHLYVTTSPFSLEATERASQPEAGSVFAIRTNVTGVPDRRFAN